jgi:ArsR family transcriptional regulator
VATPLHQAKAELFRTLGHPVRVRVLELLQEGPLAVHELLAEIDIEPSNLSQQLAVLRRAGFVTTRREGAAVVYALADPRIAELLAVSRQMLIDMATATRDELQRA